VGLYCFLFAALALARASLPLLATEAEGWNRWERSSAVLVLGFCILVGANWALALVHALTAAGLWTCTGLFLGLAFWLFRRHGWPRWRRPDVDPLAVWTGLVLLAGAAYLVLRGSLAMIAEFDAVSYHLPKAVEILKSGTIPFVNAGDYRIPYFPWNYELLLADTLILTGGDRHAYLIGFLGTLALGVNAYGLLRQAWREATALEALLGVLFLAATPVLLMHADAFKNDVLFCFFLLAFFHWAAVWSLRGSRGSFILLVLCVGLCFGTKSSALFLGPILLGLAWWHRDRFRPQALGGTGKALQAAAAILLAALLLGGGWPLLNLRWCGHLLGDFATVGGAPGYEAMAAPRYIGFGNWWKFPILLFSRPFSSNPDGVWLFWEHRYWFWPAYRSMYGHFGWLCTALLALLPFGIRLHRRQPGEEGRFRILVTVFAVAFAFLFMPQRYRVDGMFCGFPRYLLFIPVLVALWGLLPFLGWLRGRGWKAGSACAGLGLSAYFLVTAVDYFVHDQTKPLEAVAQLLDRPGYRMAGGAAKGVDRAAGPGDVIAFDSGFGGMVYPLYGRGFTRRVAYLRVAEGQPVSIPAEAKWVVTDRAWNVGWSHPGVTSAGDFWLPIRPAATREDLTLFNQLAKDPDFALVYHNAARNEAVFLRRRYLAEVEAAAPKGRD